MRRHRPACVVIKLLLGRCFRCRQMVDGNVHSRDGPLELHCEHCCPECHPGGPSPSPARHFKIPPLQQDFYACGRFQNKIPGGEP